MIYVAVAIFFASLFITLTLNRQARASGTTLSSLRTGIIVSEAIGALAGIAVVVLVLQ